MTVRNLQLYLTDSVKNSYIKQINKFWELCSEKILPVFDYDDNTFVEYRDKIKEEKLSQQTKDEPDYETIFCDAHDDAQNYCELLSLMNYRTLSMCICCLCQIWEQQLYCFILDEAKHERIEYKKEIKKNFKFCKDVFSCHNVKFEDLSCWKKINEMRLLVNTIKHAEGRSEQNLREIRADLFFDYSSRYIDSMKIHHSSLLEETLKIEIRDFNEYYEAIKKFWEELPKRMYTNKL